MVWQVKKRYKKPRTVELVRSTYQPTKAELKEDLRVDATMDEIGSALVQPVNVRWIDKPRNRHAEGGFADLASPPWVGGREQRRQGEGESSGAPADGEVTRDYLHGAVVECGDPDHGMVVLRKKSIQRPLACRS